MAGKICKYYSAERKSELDPVEWIQWIQKSETEQYNTSCDEFFKMYTFKRVVLETKDETDQVVDLTTSSYFTYIYSNVLAKRMVEQMKKSGSNRIKVYEYKSRMIQGFISVMNFHTINDILPGNPYEFLAVAETYQSKRMKFLCKCAIFNAVSLENVLQSVIFFSQDTEPRWSHPCRIAHCMKLIAW